MVRRLFVSIPISKVFQESFDRYKDLYSLKGIRWVPKENFHVTLHFIGGIDEEGIASIVDSLREIALEMRPFHLVFSEVHFAPPGKIKRMVWGEFEKSDSFQYLVHRISSALDSSYDPVIKRIPIPHVTLARIKNSKKIKGLELSQPDLENKTLDIISFDLQESQLNPEGTRYILLKSFPFGSHS